MITIAIFKSKKSALKKADITDILHGKLDKTFAPDWRIRFYKMKKYEGPMSHEDGLSVSVSIRTDTVFQEDMIDLANKFGIDWEYHAKTQHDFDDLMHQIAKKIKDYILKQS